MGPGATYAVVTFCTGVLLVLAWLYATASNPRSGAMLKKSLLLFVVPVMLAPIGWLTSAFGLWAWVACEEALKAFASTREEDRVNKFWLVTLFGIWELTLDKPFWGLLVGQSGESWGRLAMAGFLYATALPVLMHAVTAAIYAFAFERRIWAAFITSWMIHTAYNEAAEYFLLSPVAVIAETVVLSAILMFLLHQSPRGAAAKGR